MFSKKCFRVNITLTEDFPGKSPSVGVAPRTIYHPNIDFHSGSVCVDQLNSSWDNIKKTNPNQLLLSIVEYVLPGLLLSPNPEDPLNKEAAEMYRSNIYQWKQRAVECLKDKSVLFENVSNYSPEF